jgi:hypothetical protein
MPIDYHNKAQEDYAESDGQNFDPPRDPLSAPFWSEQDVEDWEQYKAGWENAKSQDND